MAITETVSEVRVLKRRIIERPRLFALLDDSKARVRTLIAPAGYGKSTLAEQWVRRSGRRGAWFTARSSSTDVAALALGLARSSATIVPGCDARLREYLRAVPAPADNVAVLAEILGEDLASWPDDAWLVIDDYHEVAQEPKSEQFVDTLIDAAPIQCLIASRQRPSWVSTKRILYGGLLELSKNALAMDNHEAAEVLLARTEASASGLVALANGWPAVIGLASVSSAEIESDVEQLPESLYRFFAEEVFSALGDEVQQGLTTLSVAPVLDRDLVHELLGADSAERIAAAALDVGILVERGAQLELHPLARAFLADRSYQFGLRPAAGASTACLTYYRARSEWDAAFEIAARGGEPGELTALLSDALDELLDGGRVSTVRNWVDVAATKGFTAPICALARSEVMLRSGRHIEAIAHAEMAARCDPTLAYRALSVAGRAAHVASREDEALELYRRAHDVASNDAERRDALWGQLVCLIELESDAATEAFEALKGTVRRAEIRDVLQCATYGLSYQANLGSLDLADADDAALLLASVSDPLLVSAFQSMYGVTLCLAARYKDALEVATAFMATIDRYRFDFAAPYASATAALASAGLRRWSDANAYSRKAVDLARHNRDGHAWQLCSSVLMRVLIQQGRYKNALELELPTVRSPLPAAQAEVIGARSLVLAAAGRVSEARRHADTVRGLSKAIEPAVLLGATDAICAIKQHDADSIERVKGLEEVAFRRGAVDLLVTAYRSAPELLRVLLRASTDHERLLGLIRKVGDQDVAALVGKPVYSGVDPRQSLSPREREVYELLIQRLTSREIGKLLFIEESTVKVHLQHIYDKLGVRSRFALALQAMMERPDQATSATESPASGETGS